LLQTAAGTISVRIRINEQSPPCSCPPRSQAPGATLAFSFSGSQTIAALQCTSICTALWSRPLRRRDGKGTVESAAIRDRLAAMTPRESRARPKIKRRASNGATAPRQHPVPTQQAADSAGHPRSTMPRVWTHFHDIRLARSGWNPTCPYCVENKREAGTPCARLIGSKLHSRIELY
jgi:hypothetical protein